MKTKNNLLKQIFAPLGLFLILASLALTLIVPANAQGVSDAINQIGKPTNLPSFDTNGHSNAAFEKGASNITSAILYGVDFLKYVMGTVAVVYIIISAIKLITARTKIDEAVTKTKEHLLFSIIGLLIIIVADQFVQQVFYGQHGEVYRSGAELKLAAERGADQVKGIYNVIEYFAAALAILMIIIAAFRLVTSGGNEEVQGKAKKSIMYAIIGLIILGIAEFAVKDIIFPKQGTTLSDIEKAKQLIVNITNFVSGFVATVAVVMYMYGGYLYVIAAGNEELSGKSKKVFIGATIGLLLAMAAFAIVSTTVKLEPTSGIKASGSQTSPTLPTQPSP